MNDFTMWKCDREEIEYKKASKQLELFFDSIRDIKNSNKRIKGFKLVYRQGQHRFSRDVMNAIKDNQILLVQAGVGIGKSMGYLIPIFTSYNNVNSFNSVVISTSNIALQQQLLTDINFVSNLLGIELKASIAKGIGNYACLSKINDLIAVSDIKDKNLLLQLKNFINTKKTIDRDELMEVSDRIWEQVKIKSRGECSRCSYSRYCLYKNISREIVKSDIVVTNHANFVRSVIDDRDYINNADMFIFDEAHKLESAIMGISQGILNLDMIRKNLDYYINNYILEDNNSVDNVKELILNIDKLFSNVRRRASYYFKCNNHENNRIKITDCDRIPFSSKGFEENLNTIIKRLQRLIGDIYFYAKKMNYSYGELRIDTLNEYLNVFGDMVRTNDSSNVYWVNYYRNNKIHIEYVSKSNINITQNIFERDIPIVCTSGTLLDANGSYNYFKKGLSLDEIDSTNRTIVDGRVYLSPYDYDNNSLFYYDIGVANPKKYKNYVEDLISRIRELIKVTNGRCLVLFTSKSTMKDVYKVLSKESFGFELMMQGQMSNSQICKRFENDVKSCLFATGAFWEGIDVKGKSLCNVIITRLPFANVDAVTENKAAYFSKKEAFKMIYLNDMIQKMAQGTGRLIRGNRDKGIICCLDSRCGKYIDIIRKCTAYTNFTSDINDVYEFSNRYITNRDGKRKIKK